MEYLTVTCNLSNTSYTASGINKVTLASDIGTEEVVTRVIAHFICIYIGIFTVLPVYILYIALNCGWKRIPKEVDMVFSRYSLGIFLDGLRKATKDLSENGCCIDRN